MDSPKRVRLISDEDLYTLLGFANATEYCLEQGRIDLAEQSIEQFKTIIKRKLEEKWCRNMIL